LIRPACPQISTDKADRNNNYAEGEEFQSLIWPACPQISTDKADRINKLQAIHEYTLLIPNATPSEIEYNEGHS
jgi:diphthamide synthase subunit DPH2